MSFVDWPHTSVKHLLPQTTMRFLQAPTFNQQVQKNHLGLHLLHNSKTIKFLLQTILELKRRKASASCQSLSPAADLTYGLRQNTSLASLYQNA